MSFAMLTVGGGGGGGGSDSDHHLSDNLMQLEMRPNPYSQRVLLGNWYEQRLTDKSDKKAITPAIIGQSECGQEKPLYRCDFTQSIAIDSTKDHEQYKEWKMQGFSNRLRGEGSNIKLWHGPEYEKNITTSNDLMFRIMPQEFAKRNDAGIQKSTLRQDYLHSYGNSTRTGLLQWRLCEARRERNTSIDRSHYQGAFKRIPLPKKETAYNQSMKKTSIV
ncbi:uncharacterized protein LOC106091186 [Stomoxys calcitrans]|uniref:uncharacterized protein LOC106091186 n=1 Tax=Stomoxys calcitrans TaxID=35570 RepID=UPI0027E24793|nr:uncharacterized protein LOC106091186 [Stomoxys calcitrans]XP_059226054.1 uncharacterized protein LOC106091186 [Stomoxys calcitrans]XP_059226055.1 uncharacterized protein LOC106091186 [Stomoxys calcitrans]XP_059226056.1 uncharacterized protein LOC106091186 [Stomoxys calcitrans]XP_059226057.1 uncharacterized protein LOC106091186 [Stomoxys calcitrans]